MNDIHALSGAYAVDALSAEERAGFEQHLAECPACREEVDSLREAAALLPAITETEPSPGVRAAVLAGITQIRPLPPLVQHGPETEALPERAGTVVPLRRRRFRTALVAAAAALIVAGGVGVGISQIDGDADGTSQEADPQEPTDEPADEVQEVLTASDVRIVDASTTLPEGTRASVHWSPSLGKAVLVTDGMPAAPAGKLYELWYQDGEGSMVRAGLMPEGEDNTVLLEGDGTGAQGIGITVEPAPHGSEQPSTDPVAFFALEDA
ncbi:MAG TPA: anti-sigma factor [Nocardioides sp.]